MTFLVAPLSFLLIKTYSSGYLLALPAFKVGCKPWRLFLEENREHLIISATAASNQRSES